MEFQEILALASQKQKKHNELIKQIDEQKRLKQIEQRQQLEIATKLYSKKVSLNSHGKSITKSSDSLGKHSEENNVRSSIQKVEENGPTVSLPAKTSVKPVANGSASQVKNGSTDKKENSQKREQLKSAHEESSVKKTIGKRKELSFNEILELAKKNVPDNIGEKRPFEDLIPCPINSKYRKADHLLASDNKLDKMAQKYEHKSEDKTKTSLIKPSLKSDQILVPKHCNTRQGIIENAVDNIESSMFQSSKCIKPKPSLTRQGMAFHNSSNIGPTTSKDRLAVQQLQLNQHGVSKGSHGSDQRRGILAQLCGESIPVQHNKAEAAQKQMDVPHKLSKERQSRDQYHLTPMHSHEGPNSLDKAKDNLLKRKSPTSSRPTNNPKCDRKKNAILAQLSGKEASYQNQPDSLKPNKKPCSVPTLTTPTSTRPIDFSKGTRDLKTKPKPAYSDRSIISHTTSREPKTSIPPPGRGIAAQLGTSLVGLAPVRTDDYDTYSDDEDYESDDSFIDDSEAPQVKEYAHVVRDIHRALNFDPRKYKEVNPYDDLRSMEAKYRDIEKEERRSARLGALEDNEEMVRDLLRKKKKLLAKKRKSL